MGLGVNLAWMLALLGAGVAARGTGVLTPVRTGYLTGFAFYVALPALVFDSTAGTDLRDVLSVAVVVGVVAAMLSVAAAAWFVHRRVGSPAARSVAVVQSYHSNFAFLGLPIVAMTLGSAAAAKASLLLGAGALVQTPLTVTLLGTMNDTETDLRTELRGVARNPVIAALVVGIALGLGYLSHRFNTGRLLASVRAVPVSRAQAPDVHDRIEALCARMDLDSPSVYVARMATPNAFALGGTRGGTLVVDESLFRVLTSDELDGVLAHELAHVESHDGLAATLAFGVGQTLAGVLSVALIPLSLSATGLAKAWAWLTGRPRDWLANPFGRLRRTIDGVSVAVLVALTLLGRARARSREFAADDRAADVTGRPLALADALRKIERANARHHGTLSSLPVDGGDEGGASDWFDTHPSVEERVSRLHERALGEGR